jgi:NAD(P)-dependent dehydrogenase (short-subunit alcohol dehydrogenase family)
MACSVFRDIQTVPALLSGFFKPLMSLMRSPAKEFCLLFHQGLEADNGPSVAAEGLLGMFLSAAQEYKSVLFRSVALDSRTDIKTAIDLAMDMGTDFVQILYHGQRPFTRQPVNRPITTSDKPSFIIRPEDLIVISGGGRGITAHLAKAMVPFEPRLVLLGRTELDPSIDYDNLLTSAAPAEEAVYDQIKKRTPDLTGNNLKREVSRIQAGMEVTRTLRDLSKYGLEVVYYTCDVSDPGDVENVIDRVIKRYGRIDGIIHGAGVIRDAFMEFMTAEDFSTVMDVKLLGGWNLCRVARDHGLRFMVGLSSIVAITGNAGQINYCAASRALSAMISAMNKAPHPLPAKALMLPPIEGIGMADDPEIRELMKLRGMDTAYVHVNELAELFCRELFLGPPDQPWVIPSRAIPQVKTVKTDPIDPVLENGDLYSAGVVFKATDLPMIQAINRLDLENGEIEAHRTFSLEYDLWLEDHKPFKFLKHPLVSGIMAVETFLETAHLLYPHMNVLGVQKVTYKDILECPPGQNREARIDCHPIETSRNRIICQLSLSSRDISPTGRTLDTWSENYQGQVILGGQECSLVGQPDPTVREDELDSPPVEQDDISKWYETGTALRGRYRVIKRLDGTGPSAVKGSTVYGEDSDFAGLDDADYQYSPYLLEALMQLVTMYVFNRDKHDGRTLIPAGIGEMQFSRRCKSGESIALEAHLKSEKTEGLSWNARATDEDGKTVMQVLDLEMKWFTA